MWRECYRYLDTTFEVNCSSHAGLALRHQLAEYYLPCPNSRLSAYPFLQVFIDDGLPLVEDLEDFPQSEEGKDIAFLGNEKVRMIEKFHTRVFLYGKSSSYPDIAITDDSKLYLFNIREKPLLSFMAIKIIREVLLTLYESKNYVSYHASSFLWKDKGVMVLGATATGKTSFLTHFCSYAQASLLSDEYAISNESFLVYDPSYIALREALLNTLAGKENASFSHSHHTLLSPKQFSDQFKCKRAEKADARLGIFLEFETSLDDALHIEELSQEKAFELLQENVVTPFKSWNHKYLLDTNLTYDDLYKLSIYQSARLSYTMKFIKVRYSASLSPKDLVKEIQNVYL